ncbi:hypothetical protein BGX38DRAFT_361994 [Terfezia claveryi]|nr:hypothetical protein BGX38DRAFT_361994 [Terfezia claveryi]
MFNQPPTHIPPNQHAAFMRPPSPPPTLKFCIKPSWGIVTLILTIRYITKKNITVNLRLSKLENLVVRGQKSKD